MSYIPKILAAILLALVTACSAPDQSAAAEKYSEENVTLGLNDLIGVWDVDLYFDPSQPPSTTVMIISAVEDGTVSGNFYGAEFERAEAVLHNGYIVFSAITSDETGPYAHGMRMHSPNHIYGQTLSTGRGFVMPWEATKRTKSTKEE